MFKVLSKFGENSSPSGADVCERDLLNLHGIRLTLVTVAARIAPPQCLTTDIRTGLTPTHIRSQYGVGMNGAKGLPRKTFS